MKPLDKSKSKFLTKYGPYALITGATDGIGKDFVYELARQGFSLLLVGRRKEILESIRSDINKEFGVTVEHLSLDLSKQADLEILIKNLGSKDIGLAVLAAGFGSGGEFSKLPLDLELNMVDVNCKACVQLSHSLVNKFEGRKKSGIILFGSLVGFQGAPFSATYSATKAFMQSFAEALYHEVKPTGIDVLSVAPGPVSSGFGNRAGMKMSMSQSSQGIAKTCLAALGKQNTVRPGFLSKFLGYSLITLPRSIRTLIMKQIMTGMVQK